jgi:3D (Asp-Asp-Asp) domain-containing protein
MKKLIILLIILCLVVSFPTYAKSKKPKPKLTYLGRFYITYYCPCAECCGAGGGKVTASGTTPTAGRTVGVNPSVIPYGTNLKIGNTYGYVAEDTGGGIGTYHIDIFVNSHAEALQKGVDYKDVWAVTYPKPVLKKNKRATFKNKIKFSKYLKCNFKFEKGVIE